MHLHRLQITNFRAIEHIETEFDSLVSVIIGPNAIGKTSVLEAIRLAKAVLAPRTQNEATHTLNKLGVTSPHMPQRLFPGALTTNTDSPTVIKCAFRVEDSEIAELELLIPQLAPNIALQSIGQTFANQAQAMGFLNSQQGQAAIRSAQTQLGDEFSKIKASKHLNLNLTVDYQTARVSGEHAAQQVLYTAVEQKLAPTQTLFSYFPADRALPVGEQPVQLGLQDSVNQLESYNSQPELKYNRLKHTIFNSIIGGASGRGELSDQFALIFEKILKGRELGEIGVNEIGMLSIPIVDKDSQKTFDIDGLSSGEKGLILTFLLIARSIAENGMILLDEPELHLNPAVCRDLLQFLVDEYASKKNMQALICSHSAEILAGAFERQSCALFHLRSGTSLARVRQKDQGEIRDALRRLGSSESEALLFKGTVSVEGLHDVEILQTGFDHIFRRYKLKQLGGRAQVENDIRELQKAEARGDEIGYHFFIFDHDGKPTTLSDTKRVRLKQLQRHCLENYLLDVDIITDLTRDKAIADEPVTNITDMTTKMKTLAMKQLNSVCAYQVFRELGLEQIGFDMSVMQNPAPGEIANGLQEQIAGLELLLQSFNGTDFTSSFESLFSENFLPCAISGQISGERCVTGSCCSKI